MPNMQTIWELYEDDDEEIAIRQAEAHIDLAVGYAVSDRPRMIGVEAFFTEVEVVDYLRHYYRLVREAADRQIGLLDTRLAALSACKPG